MTRLSVNINKIATIRNSRGGNVPNVTQVALDCISFGADGITVHPRPDERHIRHSDVRDLKSKINTELNIEGYPSTDFINLVLEVHPAQVTLVPDAPDAITSNAGWDIPKNKLFLSSIVDKLKKANIRVSIFIEANIESVEQAALLGTDRVELYTEPYASMYLSDKRKAIAPFLKAARRAKELNIELNAGHDLNLLNLPYFHQNIPWLEEVSIGHALISDALYLGLKKTIQDYQKAINNII